VTGLRAAELLDSLTELGFDHFDAGAFMYVRQPHSSASMDFDSMSVFAPRARSLRGM
jgi:hypothetical protein